MYNTNEFGKRMKLLRENAGLTQEELVRLFVDQAHLALNDGTMFGEPGKGFMRLNIGCPRSVLEQALKQLETAVADK